MANPSTDLLSKLAQQLITIANTKWFHYTEHFFALFGLFLSLHYLRKKGLKKIVGNVLGTALNVVPGAAATVSHHIEKEVEGAINSRFKPIKDAPAIRSLPLKGLDLPELEKVLKIIKGVDAQPEDGRIFAYSYPATGDHEEKVALAFKTFMHENGVSPFVFPSLRKFEVDLLSIATNLLNGDENVRGTLTAGGTESILLAVKTYRDRARHLFSITQPEMVLPRSAHPAFFKAAEYFGVKPIPTELQPNYRADVAEMRKRITRNTILLVGSAPQYPHGIVDPIREIAELAREFKLPMHVDACVGGFILPFISKLGYPIPDFDFSVPGVTSISADLHKYGYALKGASTILYRNNEIRKYQFFALTTWCGGLFVSPSMLGTRSGGSIAAAWASLIGLGEEGFLERTKSIMETSIYLQKEINSIPELEVIGKPNGSIISFRSKKLNIHAICDQMEEKYGWHMERQQLPDSVHMTIMPSHFNIKEKFITDLKESIEIVRKNPRLESSGNAALYGLVARIPVTSLVTDFLTTFMSKVYQ